MPHHINRNVLNCYKRLLVKSIIFAAIGVLLVQTGMCQAEPRAKWQPGHYMRFEYSQNKEDMQSFLDNQYTKGLYIKIPWRVVEPSKNGYNFAEIDELLEFVRQNDRYLILSILDRCFGSNCSHAYAPDYLQDAPYNGGVAELKKSDGSTKGYIVRLWDPAVTDRMIKLYQALGERYESNPRFVGYVVLEETTMAIDRQNIPIGYTPEAYVNEIKRLAGEFRSAMPTTIPLLGINWIPEESERVAIFRHLAEQMVSSGLGGLTHPDTLPGDDRANPKFEIDKGLAPIYDIEDDFSTKLAIAPSIGPWHFSKELTMYKNGAVTREELIHNFCINKLKANYIFWNNKLKTGQAPELDIDNSEEYINDHVLPVINKKRGEIIKAYPTAGGDALVPSAPSRLTLRRN